MAGAVFKLLHDLGTGVAERERESGQEGMFVGDQFQAEGLGETLDRENIDPAAGRLRGIPLIHVAEHHSRTDTGAEISGAKFNMQVVIPDGDRLLEIYIV